MVLQNYVRIAHTWLDEQSLIEFYTANGMQYDKDVIPDYVGNFSGWDPNSVLRIARLEMKKNLNCKPFPTYLKQFKGRTFCKSGDGR